MLESISPLRLTILTATFNRAHLLPRLFHSICDETFGDHEIDWLIVDDGSADGTAQVVSGFKNQDALPVTYVRIQHGGKHRALNEGFDRAEGDWILVVDSDDWIAPGGLFRLRSEVLCAQYLGASLIQLPLIVPKAERQYSFLQPDRLLNLAQRLVEEPSFDSSLIFSKSLFPNRFPEFAGEFFLAESALIFQMADHQKFYVANSVAVYAEYQLDGLSRNLLLNRINSAIGSTFVYQQILGTKIPPNLRLRSLANFGRFWWHAALRRKNPTMPRDPLQWLALFVCWPFTLRDYCSKKYLLSKKRIVRGLREIEGFTLD